MRRTEAIAWVVSVCAVSLRLSQAKTLAALVASAMRVERVSLANIGRRMLGSAKAKAKGKAKVKVKHQTLLAVLRQQPN